ncbi:MAG: ABC transporter ATP-binding protein [Clostridiales bacterium]|jgi:ATP-binding cassette subfamily B multidrug efflux pump|nr:ABC transporter ATP-binding protein [Clostridiales bacterium]
MKLAKYIKPYLLFAILSPLMMVVEVLVDLIQPTLMSVIVDDGVIAGDLSKLARTGLLMLLLVVVGGIGGLSASYFSAVASQGFGRDLRGDIFRRVMDLSLSQTDKFSTGSLVTRLTNDVTMLQNFVAMVLRMFIRAPLLFVGGIIMALSLDVSFSIVLACAMPIELIIVLIVVLKARPLFDTVQKKIDNVNSIVQENIMGARVVKAFVREEHQIGKFDDANRDLRDTTLYVQKLLAILHPTMMIIMNVSVVAIILIGGLQVQAGALEVGKIMAAITYVVQILFSLMMVAMMFQMLSRAMASARRINEVLDEKPAIMSGSSTPERRKGGGSVKFENVSFRYPGTSGKPVLSDINLDIKPGEYIAILGATGSGKSSLVKLIPRFYDVTEGRVLVNGIDVRDFDLKNLRERIAFVLQTSELFSGTVADNIRFGYEDATDEEVRRAAKIAQADEFISSFVDGYDTYVAEKGASLSGGQKQRIAIARAILRKPEIIIFDDSTSALDVGTESSLRAALRSELKDTTIIMIAQRITSVMTADRIAVIEDGIITACAPHDELLETSETYRDIYNSQIGQRDLTEEDIDALGTLAEGGAVGV